MTSSTVTSHPPLTTIALEQACPSCGADITNLLQQLAQSAQSRIAELEAQVRILTDKATAAVDKLADYEDQLHQLKSSSQPRPQSADHLDPINNPDQQPPPPASSDPTIQIRSPFQARLSSLLPSSRRSASQPPSSAPATQLTHSQSVRQPPSQPQPSSSHHHHHHTTSNPLPTDLHAALEQERSLRLAAEAHLSTTQTEIEDLSTSLFSEANELVAAERRALHDLQTRYDALQEEARGLRDRDGERVKEAGRLQARLGVLEGREGEKGRRWEELERRVCRVEKVKALLREDGGGRRVVSAGVVEGKGVLDDEGC
ncbi:MAG: hypothetical protein LQ339_000060 [Xanthoria mediterranea]|nr:MAG: hypothetical protein LQ339_000060 [Xanthoria mediterranea]